MTSFPYPSRSHLVERVDRAPEGARVRRWVLRDDNRQHYHGVVPLHEDPAVVELFWKADARGREQRVGLFLLHLSALLAEGYVRREREGPDDDIRLRFHRGDRGVVVIQINGSGPALQIGTVDVSE